MCERLSDALAILCGFLCDLCASVVKGFRRRFTTETRRSHRVTQRV